AERRDGEPEPAPHRPRCWWLFCGSLETHAPQRVLLQSGRQPRIQRQRLQRPIERDEGALLAPTVLAPGDVPFEAPASTRRELTRQVCRDPTPCCPASHGSRTSSTTRNRAACRAARAWPERGAPSRRPPWCRAPRPRRDRPFRQYVRARAP